LLLRLWLSVPSGRALPDGWEHVFGTKEAGAVRGGVPSREGWRDVKELRAHRRADKSGSRIEARYPQSSSARGAAGG
jgi:hypothetical protein